MRRATWITSCVMLAGLVVGSLSGCSMLSGHPPSVYDLMLHQQPHLKIVHFKAERSPTIDEAQLAQLIHDEVNRTRLQHGLTVLDWDDRVAVVAQHHSQDMANRDYFSHTDSEGRNATERGQALGVECRIVEDMRVTEGMGENLFWTLRYEAYEANPPQSRPRRVDWKDVDQLAVEAVTAWMESPGHRANLLSPVYTNHGIGIARAEGTGVYVTQNLCF